MNRFSARGLRSALAACGALLAASSAGMAQNVAFKPPSGATQTAMAKDIGFSEGSFIAAPIPFQNPVLESGLALGGAYLFQNPGSSGSSIGVGGFKTTNGSQGYGLGFDLNFDNDRWRTNFLLADVDLNYDLDLLGAPIPLSQTGRGGRAQALYGLVDDVYVGAGVAYATSTLGLDPGRTLPNGIKLDADLEIASFSLLANWDRRDNTYYPTKGTLVSGDLSYSEVLSARDRSYFKGVATAAGYKSVLGNGVFAWQGAACASGEEAPFFDSCSLGGTDSFRGFSSTQYIDNALLSVQAEYRGILFWRIGYVAFAGVGTTGNDFGEAVDGPFRVAAGLGARFRLSKTFPLDYSIDLSYNDEQESLLYVFVGQRF